jgi:hypothetical protein
MIARRFVPLLLLACAAPGAKQDADTGTSTAATDSIVLERSICFGTCPAYRLRLSADGEIRFESRNPGDKIGAAIDTVSPVTLSSLVSRARSIGFFDLPQKIMGDSVLCPISRTDAPTAVVAIFTKDGATRVDDYYGCGERVGNKILPALARLRAFENEIDSVLQSSRWVRPATRR